MLLRVPVCLALVLSLCPVVDAQQNRRPPTSPTDKFARYQVAAGTALLLKLRTPIDSATVAIDQQVDAVLWSPVVQDGVELVPTGSVVIGRVTAVARANWNKPMGSVSIAFAVVEHAETGDRATLNTRALSFEATPPAPPPGKKPKVRPTDIVLTEGTPVVAMTTEPLVVRIPK